MGIGQDIRYALRTFARSPGFTLAALLTLGLGIGGSAAIFSVVRVALFPPQPFPGAERMVRIVENIPASEDFKGVPRRATAISVGEIEWWRERSTTLTDFSVSSGEQRTMNTAEGPIRVRGSRVSPEWFSMRGVRPVAGRWLQADDAPTAAIISTSTWRRHFGQDPAVLSRALVLDGRPYTIVGVMPAEAGETPYWRLFVQESAARGPALEFTAVAARLRDGVSIEAANEEVNALGSALRNLTPAPGAARRFEVERVLDQQVAAVRPAMRILTGSAGALLLIVCANMANLLLVRGTRRRQEMEIRRALGADRVRIVRQALTESLVLSSMGGVVGTALAFAGVRLLQVLAAAPATGRYRLAGNPIYGLGSVVPGVENVTPDYAMLGFALAVAVVIGVLFGMAPALRLGRPATIEANRTGRPAGGVLAVTQIALATALLIGAGLLVRSFTRLSSIDKGFDPRGALAFQIVLPQQYPISQKLTLAQELVQRLNEHGTIEAAGFANMPLLTAVGWGGGVAPDGSGTQSRTVSREYFQALGVRLVEGRWFEERDSGGDAQAVLVNRAYARRYFPGGGAVGATLRGNGRVFQIVGVIGDVPLTMLTDETDAAMFLDVRQVLARGEANDNYLFGFDPAISFTIRGAGADVALEPELRAMVRRMDPAIAVDGIVTMQRAVESMTAGDRFYAVFAGIFGTISGLLAMIGVYGVLSYTVTQRTREFGIRMALGARRSAVLAQVLGRGVAMIAVGIPAGLLGASALTRYLSSMLYGVTALDAAIYATVAGVFAIVVLMACYVPARRAMRVDPMVALRHE